MTQLYIDGKVARCDVCGKPLDFKAGVLVVRDASNPSLDARSYCHECLVAVLRQADAKEPPHNQG